MRDELQHLVEQLRAIGPISPRLQVDIITEVHPDFELEELAEAIHALGGPDTAERIRRAALREKQRRRAADTSGGIPPCRPDHHAKKDFAQWLILLIPRLSQLLQRGS